MECAVKLGFLSGTGHSAGWEAMVDSFADGGQDHAELFKAEAAALGLCRAPELLDKARREHRGLLRRCGLLPGSRRQNEFSGFGRDRIHDPEDTALVLPGDDEKSMATAKTATE